VDLPALHHKKFRKDMDKLKSLQRATKIVRNQSPLVLKKKKKQKEGPLKTC
jgi:hypothetical protein